MGICLSLWFRVRIVFRALPLLVIFHTFIFVIHCVIPPL
uniref:Uncharacterized protein n=1 Tax=Siphoviridae sp. ctNEy24 TaxID=2825466 RepID=A0A8S5U0K2_9CAUD|nr:MAG TPA: hypothetical protein [Siphoviridae sp. ctNEy24]